MPHASELLDRWMKATGHANQTEAALALGKSGPTTISNWRSGYAKPDDETIVIICGQCGENPQFWLAMINQDFAKNETMRRLWKAIARSALTAAAGASAIAIYATAV